MGANAHGKLPKDLMRGRSRFQAWRRRRKAGARIPLPLWALAVRLAHTYGISRTAAALGLDYYGLKKRAETAASEPQASGPTVVEVPSPVMVGKRCLVQLDN